MPRSGIGRCNQQVSASVLDASMVAIDVTPYPGAGASAEDILRLADEYRDAARTLLVHRCRKGAISLAPIRLCAIHAIELYLNVFLLRLGEPPEQVRGRQHNLARRAASAVAGGLLLRKRTREHLAQLDANREYVATRYGPEQAAALSQINLLMATLAEVGTKVGTTPKGAAG